MRTFFCLSLILCLIGFAGCQALGLKKAPAQAEKQSLDGDDAQATPVAAGEENDDDPLTSKNPKPKKRVVAPSTTQVKTPQGTLIISCLPKIKDRVPGREGWQVVSAKVNLDQEMNGVLMEVHNNEIHCFYKRPQAESGYQLEIYRTIPEPYVKCERKTSISFECFK